MENGDYYCKPCDYKTDRYANFVRHTNSTKHHKKCNEINNKKIVGKHSIKVPGQGDYIMNSSLEEYIKHALKYAIDYKISYDKDKSISSDKVEVNHEKNMTNKTVYGSGVYVCKYCGREFTLKNSKYKHQVKCKEKYEKTSKEQLNNDDIKSSTESDEEELSKDEKLKLYERKLANYKEKLKDKEKQIDKLLETNVNATKTSANVSESNNRSMHMMTYAIKYFKNAPVLKQLEKAQIKEVIEYNGSVNSYDDVFEYVEEILFEYKKKRIIPYIGKLIGTYFNIHVPYVERSAWATDVSRLSFIVMQHVGTGKEWSNDKSGQKFTNSVINPTVDFINKVLKQFIDMESKNQDEYFKEFDKDRNKCEKIMGLRGLAVQFMEEILTDKFKKELLKFIAPYFNFDTKRTVNTGDGTKTLNESEKADNKVMSVSSMSSESSFESVDKKPKKVQKKAKFLSTKSSSEEKPKKVTKKVAKI